MILLSRLIHNCEALSCFTTVELCCEHLRPSLAHHCLPLVFLPPDIPSTSINEYPNRVWIATQRLSRTSRHMHIEPSLDPLASHMSNAKKES
jgi:hypothetical protein